MLLFLILTTGTVIGEIVRRNKGVSDQSLSHLETSNFFDPEFCLIQNSFVDDQASSKSSGYVFSPSEYETQRLARLNEIYNPNTIKILGEYISPGMAVLEIGPGTGEIAAWINQKITATGFYAAIDIDDTNFDAIRSNNSNARLLKASITDIKPNDIFDGQKFDVIFCRWVLSYIPQEQRKLALEKMNQLLKSAGKLIAEEFDLYAAHCVSTLDINSKVECPALDGWKELSKKVEEKFPLDFTLGPKLETLMRDGLPSSSILAGLSFQGLFSTKRHKQVLSYGMLSAKQALVGANIKNESGYDDLITELEVLENNESQAVHYIEDIAVIAIKR